MSKANTPLSEVIYPDTVEKYSTHQIPARENQAYKHIACLVSNIYLSFFHKGCKIKKTNMKGLKPPYILLINHLQPIDFYVMFKATYPHNINIVSAYNTFYGKTKIMENFGCMPTRKFVTDPTLVRSCKTVLKDYGDVFCMFPEARYTPDGTLSVLPESIGKLVKKNGVPVVVMLMHGGHIKKPYWAVKSRKAPLCAEMKQILTAEQVKGMSIDEINSIIRKEMYYDDYRYQQENNILVTEPYRAEGLNKILYQCPNCKTEHKMKSEGIHLWCEECGKKWELTEKGNMAALDGNTEFTHIPDWYNWERENVHNQILDGTYYYSDNVYIYSTPGVKEYTEIGNGKVTHSLENGFVIEFSYKGNDYKIERPAKNMYSIQTEYSFAVLNNQECFNVTTANDGFFCIPTQKDVITKIMLATEEMYKILNDK